MGAGDELVSAAELYGGTYNQFHYTLPKIGVEGSSPTRRISTPYVRRSRSGRRPFMPRPTPRRSTPWISRGLRRWPMPASRSLSTTLCLSLPGQPEHGGRHRPLCDQVHRRARHVDRRRHSGRRHLPWDNGKFPGFTEPDPSYHGLEIYPTLGELVYLEDPRPRMRSWTNSPSARSTASSSCRASRRCPCGWVATTTNAQAVAEFLQVHPKVNWVNYPGLEDHPSHELAAKYHREGLFGAILGFRHRRRPGGGQALHKRVELHSLLANVGDAKSLVIHPASTTHSQLSVDEQKSTGVTDDYVRLSVGLESIDDILYDLDTALNGA